MPLIAEASDREYVHVGTSGTSTTRRTSPPSHCDADDGTRIYTDHKVIGTRCTTCGLIYTSPRLTEPERIYWGDGDL